MQTSNEKSRGLKRGANFKTILSAMDITDDDEVRAMKKHITEKMCGDPEGLRGRHPNDSQLVHDFLESRKRKATEDDTPPV